MANYITSIAENWKSKYEHADQFRVFVFVSAGCGGGLLWLCSWLCAVVCCGCGLWAVGSACARGHGLWLWAVLMAASMTMDCGGEL